jgi:hypothetical protein
MTHYDLYKLTNKPYKRSTLKSILEPQTVFYGYDKEGNKNERLIVTKRS